ncbi:MAG: zinc transport system ATP-binding protein [Thermosediminibacterales bacterium]|nr:zinc transport system ATP-binding protein [Thermosediminibacterales bacterium]MDK2835356.1 zinc transport system ATP-binding protein [Thermosediminibacterales bacterium]
MYDLELKNVNVYYDKVCALKNINLQVKKSEFLGIIGPNGGGKTTLLKLILGMIKPSSGIVNINENITIGYVPQTSNFNKHFPIKVLDVILMGRLDKSLKLFHKYTKEDVEKVGKIMERLGILELRDRQVGELSGGQLQKVLIARALAVEPKMLLLDEPTANIDVQSKTEIFEILKKLNEQVTIILVTHDIGIMSSYVDTIAFLNQKLYYHGAAKTDGVVNLD